MKQILSLAFFLVLLISCQQQEKGYVIHGHATGVENGKVYLKAYRNKMYFDYDSAEISNGEFTFKGEVEYPLVYGLLTEGLRSPSQFMLENRVMDLTIGEKGELTVLNSPENELFFENARKVHARKYNIDSLITAHPSSPAAVFYLYRYFTYQLSLEQLKETRAKIDPSLKDLPYVKDLDGIIEQLEQVQIGKVAPDFTLPDPSGHPVSLKDFRGKYVLIDFWAAWCPPCRRENPNVVAAFQEFKNKGFTVLGVSLDYNKQNWLKAIEDDHLTWAHVSDLKYWDSEIPALYGVRGIPANVLIDPEGIILATNITGEALHNKLKEVMP